MPALEVSVPASSYLSCSRNMLIGKDWGAAMGGAAMKIAPGPVCGNGGAGLEPDLQTKLVFAAT